MTDLQKAETAVRLAYLAEAIHHQKANARYFCAPVCDRAVIAKDNAKDRAVFEQQVIEAEANLAKEKAKGEE